MTVYTHRHFHPMVAVFALPFYMLYLAVFLTVMGLVLTFRFSVWVLQSLGLLLGHEAGKHVVR